MHDVSLCCGPDTYRVTAGPLLVVINEDVVPRDGPHVESVKGAEYPEEGHQDQRGQQDVETSIEATQTAGALLQVCLLLDLAQSVPVHLEVNIETFSFVPPVLDGPRHSQKAVATCLLDQFGLLVGGDVVLVLQCHVDTVTSYRLRPHTLRVEDLNGLVVCINSKQIFLFIIQFSFNVNLTSFAALVKSVVSRYQLTEAPQPGLGGAGAEAGTECS